MILYLPRLGSCAWAFVALALVFLGTVRLTAGGGSSPELTAALAKVDRVLLAENEADIRAWLDARIADTGDFGLYHFGRPKLRVEGDVMRVDLNRGGTADSAAQFLRAYEMLGDRRYLEAGLKTADFFLQVQQPAGDFPSGATIQRGGKATAGGGKHPVHEARLEDGYQYRPFALLLYAYRLSGETKYLAGALRLGELITQRVQHPKWGWSPDHFDTTDPDPYSSNEFRTSNYGVAGGGSYSDHCTSDMLRISVMMYHLTSDKRHLERSKKLGDWIHATQMGLGDVRGWADNYGPDNRPVPAREFEGLEIDPRNFNRFTGPMLMWLYVVTGEERHRRLFEETYRWMRAVEQPDGWAAEYTYDGRPAWTQGHITYLYDEPSTWPETLKHLIVKDGRPWYGRDKVQLEDCQVYFNLVSVGGREALRRMLFAPDAVSWDEQRYEEERLAAALRCASERLDLRTPLFVADANHEPAVYLDRVRGRPVAIRDSSPAVIARQSWSGYGSDLSKAIVSWQYVWDARLALGLIDARTASLGGRGMEIRLFPKWNMMGDWTVRTVKRADWFEVPLGP